MLQPLSMYTLFRVFPPEQRGIAMGLFGVSVILGPALGPTLGGVMIDQFNWRAIFYVAVPVSARGHADGQPVPAGARGDGRARALRLAGLRACSARRSPACSRACPTASARAGIPTTSSLCSRSPSLAAVGFFVWELRAPQPLVNLKVLANPQFTGAATVACIFGVGSVRLHLPRAAVRADGAAPDAARGGAPADAGRAHTGRCSCPSAAT